MKNPKPGQLPVGTPCASAGPSRQSPTSPVRLHREMRVDQLLDALDRGQSVTLHLPNGQSVFVDAVDLLRTQEALLLFAAMECVLLKLTDIGCEPGNAKICQELEIESPARPTLCALIKGSEGKLGKGLAGNLRRLKERRDGLLHGTDPVFTKRYVKQVRHACAEVMKLAPDAVSPDLHRQITLCQSARNNNKGWKHPDNTALLRSLLRLVAIEVTLREYLQSIGIATRSLKAINCLHRLLDSVSEQDVRWPRGMAWNLLKVLILRNALAHGHIFELTVAHLAVVQRADQNLDQVLGNVAVRKAGGSVSLGELGNSALAMGLVAITTVGGRLPS